MQGYLAPPPAQCKRVAQEEMAGESGLNSSWSRRPFCINSDRNAQAGEQVLLELDTAADGYHNDLTRMLASGSYDPHEDGLCRVPTDCF